MATLSLNDLSILEGWVTLSDAANRMKLSTNGLRKRIFEYGEIDAEDLRIIPLGNTNSLILLRAETVERAVEAELREREDYQVIRRPVLDKKKAKQEQRRGIIAWAEKNGWSLPGYPQPIVGRLSTKLTDAYTKATGDELIK